MNCCVLGRQGAARLFVKLVYSCSLVVMTLLVVDTIFDLLWRPQSFPESKHYDACSLQHSFDAAELCRRKKDIERHCSAFLPRQYAWYDKFRRHPLANRKFPPHLVVSERWKVLYCLVPKVASNAWSHYFEQAGPLHRLSDYSAQEVHEILETYTKIMWLRNPIDRLVSAWRDKLSQYNRYYSRAVGSKIIARYRPNATRFEIERGYPTSFDEFIRYLADEPVASYDVHWRPQTELCLVCRLQWDFYGALERAAVESPLIMAAAYANAGSSSTNIAWQSLPTRRLGAQGVVERAPELRRVLSRAYKRDLAIFGYKMPQ